MQMLNAAASNPDARGQWGSSWTNSNGWSVLSQARQIISFLHWSLSKPHFQPKNVLCATQGNAWSPPLQCYSIVRLYRCHTWIS